MITALATVSSAYPRAAAAQARAETASAVGSRTAAEAEPSTGADDAAETSVEVQREITRLAQRDREVRSHEQAHVSAGGALVTSGPTYQYVTGPDGRRYANGGEVGIDTSPVRGDPEATADKARRIRAAALAPADPSSQDRQVAAKASRMEREAQLEIARQQRDQAYSSTANEGQDRPGLRLSEVA